MSCEAIEIEFNKLKSELSDLREELALKIEDWKHHFEWLKSLDTSEGPVQKEVTKSREFFEQVKDFFEILLEVSKWNARYHVRHFLKWFYRKREALHLKMIDRMQSRFDKKLSKKHSKIIKLRERWFQVRINLGEMI